MRSVNKKGLTLLELIVTISISTIIITFVLSSWNYLNQHVSHQENKGIIRDETARVAEELMLRLRRTPGVLQFTPTSVTLLSHNSSDTLEYAFDGENLNQNGTPVQFGVRGASITSFHVNSKTVETLEYLLLEITLTSSGNRNNHDTSRFVVNAKNGSAVSLETGWGF
ncbi:MAG: prepilin-type N-terminal cleavage/methylation domain-containing protein [Chitinispirillia bacterium]|nr:prepilin-type N-terminal cleavage/methylation domain-containing protein [Chitinispirillia bacterium]